jgi:PqqD family protein of HPr-rel-A system
MTARLYRADAPAQRIAAPLDEMTAIYHRPSGTTHLVAAPVPELLDALAEGPADAATLLARLERRYEVGDADPRAIAARLDEMVATGLAWVA